MKTDVIINREALYALRELPSESVNCCVTSPPYYGLRDYGLDVFLLSLPDYCFFIFIEKQ